MTKTAQRFYEKVDRSGDHHLWTGAKKANGTGQVRMNGKLMTAQRAAWELVNGRVPEGAKVRACFEEPACVRIEHLDVDGLTADIELPVKTTQRSRKGGGSLRKVRSGFWKLEVTNGTYADGTPRRAFRTVQADNETDAAGKLAEFVVEVRNSSLPSKELRGITMDEAIEQFLEEHLFREKGRERQTVDDYKGLHDKWFSPQIGHRRVRDIDEAMLDRLFGDMRVAGLSRSRMNHAKSLYRPFFRWVRTRQMSTRNPMSDFQLPTSQQVSKERLPPEVHELSILLNEALNVVPDVAPMLVLDAVTGMRRGEIVGLRRSLIGWEQHLLKVDTAIDAGGKTKTTKTRKVRTFYVDAETVEMLRRHCEQMDERAALFGTTVDNEAFVFSLEPDCSTAMSPNYFTKRVAELKDHLGIADKKPETIELENIALALSREVPADHVKKRGGPATRSGGLSYLDISKRIQRSERWVSLAVRSAERREAALKNGTKLDFDGSIIALRKFTSSELLDAGFNISLVAQRQGHSPQVLAKHYSKAGKSADRKAAEHLGNVVHNHAKQK